MNWADCPAVDRDPERCGGVWCFAGTRLPVVTLFEHLETGVTIDEFLEWFPGTTEEQVRQVIAFAKDSLRPLQ
jgi:uncharacterized protein (DUF433 family)